MSSDSSHEGESAPERRSTATWATDAFDWTRWERTIRNAGITLDRPRFSRHPHFAEIVYPIDYGFVNGTTGADGAEVDVFVGHADTGLVGAIVTRDHRKGDEELKLLWNCSATDVYLVHGFINFDPTKMEGRLTLRVPMGSLWGDAPVDPMR